MDKFGSICVFPCFPMFSLPWKRAIRCADFGQRLRGGIVFHQLDHGNLSALPSHHPHRTVRPVHPFGPFGPFVLDAVTFV